MSDNEIFGRSYSVELVLDGCELSQEELKDYIKSCFEIEADIGEIIIEEIGG